jgi:hypothetical protein
MSKILSPKKALLLLGFALSINAFASFIDNGSANKKKKDTINFSLKNFNRNSFQQSAYPGFRLSGFQFKGSTDIYQYNTKNAIVGQTFLKMEKGNTTYVFPYKYKVKVPFFKTPTQPAGLQ